MALRAGRKPYSPRPASAASRRPTTRMAELATMRRSTSLAVCCAPMRIVDGPPARSRRSCSTWPSGAGRLGMILIGAQQTASEVERRIVANSAIRVVGRLDAAEAGRGEYGFLPGAQRDRAKILKPGTMLVAQPELPDPARRRVPVPGLGHPGQRGRRGRRRRGRDDSRRARRPLRGAPVRFLHTGDWHVGKALRGRSRADEHRAVLAEIAALAEAEQVDAVLVAGDLFDTAAPVGRERADRLRGAARAARAPAPTSSSWPATTTTSAGCRRSRPCSSCGRVTVAASFRRPDDGGVIEVPVPRRRASGRGSRAARSCPSAGSSGPTSSWRPPPTSRRRPTASACASSIAALTAGFSAGHGQRRRRPPLRHRAACSVGASGRPRRSSTTPCRPRPSRPTPSTSPSATSTAAR